MGISKSVYQACSFFTSKMTPSPPKRPTGEINVTEPTCSTKVTEISGGPETAREELSWTHWWNFTQGQKPCLRIASPKQQCSQSETTWYQNTSPANLGAGK